MNVELYILIAVAFLEHSIVEDVGYLGYLSRRVHDWHILLDPEWSLRWGLVHYRLHGE